MSRRKQSNPKPLKRSFLELLVEIAKTLFLPEDLILKPHESISDSLKSFNSIDNLEKNSLNGSIDDNHVNLNDQIKPKSTNSTHLIKNFNGDINDNLKDHFNIKNTENILENQNTSDDEYSKYDKKKQKISIKNESSKENNSKLKKLIDLKDQNDNKLKDDFEYSNTEFENQQKLCNTLISNEENELDDNNSTSNFNNNQDNCVFYSIYPKSKLEKGFLFGPYSVKINNTKIINDDQKENCVDSFELKSENDNIKKEYLKIQEKSGFWLKIIRKSSKPTASIKMKENKVYCELLEDLNDETELSIDEKYCFTTYYKSLNNLNTSTMITDEILDNFLEEDQIYNNTENKNSNESDDELIDNNSELKENFNEIKNQVGKFDEELKMNGQKNDGKVIEGLNFLCTFCNIRFSNKDTLSAHQNFYCLNKKNMDKDQVDQIQNAFNLIISTNGSLDKNDRQEKRSLDESDSDELHSKKKIADISNKMCNNNCNQTIVNEATNLSNNQATNENSSDSDESNNQKDEKNSSRMISSIGNLNNIQQQNLTVQLENFLSNSLIDQLNTNNTTRVLQTMNLLLGSNQNLDENRSQVNPNMIESIQRLFNDNNQNLTNSLIAAAAAANAIQRSNWFTCKFCNFTTSKRQQLIKHVRTSCEGILTAVANLNNSTSKNSNSSAATQNNVTIISNECNSPINDQNSVDTKININEQNQNTPSNASLMAAALSCDQLNSGCGNIVCVNSNCTNGNSCVILPNSNNLMNINDKSKMNGINDDSEDSDFANSSNPQDRYCMECEIQFASFKNYKVHKQFYCGSRHCNQKIQQPLTNNNSRKRTASESLNANNHLNCSSPSSILAANTAVATTAAVNNINSLIIASSSESPPPSSAPSSNYQSSTSQSSQQQIFNTLSGSSQINSNSSIHSLCKNNSLLNTNANTSEAGSPGLQLQSQNSTGLQQSASLAGLNTSSNHCLPLSNTSSNMNAHQAAILNELFANGNIINLSSSLNLIQQLNQPVYIAISTNPLILLPINSGINNYLGLSSASTSTTTTTTKSTFSSNVNQDSNEQFVNSHLNGLLSQAVLESLNKGNNPFALSNIINQQQQTNQTQSSNAVSTQTTLNVNCSSLNSSPSIPLSINSTNSQRAFGDEPIDLSAKRKCVSRLGNVTSLYDQQQNSPTNSQQMLNNLTTDATVAAAAAAFLLPKSLSINAVQQQQQLQQLILKQQQPRIFSCNNCQIDFHKQENYTIHKKYYCSATKMLLEQSGQKQNEDFDTSNQQINSEPNSPQSLNNNLSRISTAASSTLTTSSFVDTVTQSKKSSTSCTSTKLTGCVSPTTSISPISSPSGFTNNNQLGSGNNTTNSLTTSTSTITPNQPLYKHFCNKCGIRFTSKDNLNAHQTYYCINNTASTNGSSNSLSNPSITNFNVISGLIEITCPKCRSTYGSEDKFLAHICTANNSMPSQTNLNPNCSISGNNQSNNLTPLTSNNISATTGNLLDAIESFKQQNLNSKLTTSLLNSAAVAAANNSLINASNNPLIVNSNLNSNTSNTVKSNNNNQAFKCTICGYKGHTLRGMKTHVRVHGDQLQGAQEENFIIPLDDCCGGLPVMNGNCTNPSCRNTRTTSINSYKRRKSSDPMSNLLSNFVLPNAATNSVINKELLLTNSLNPLLSNSIVNGLMGNLVNNLTNQLGNQIGSHLVSGLVGASLSNNVTNNSILSTGPTTINSGSSSSINDLLSAATSEMEDNDNLDTQQHLNMKNSNLSNSVLNSVTTCNGTAVVNGIASSSNNIGKC